MVAVNLNAAVMFNDLEAVEEIVSVLAIDQAVMNASIVKSEGQIVAELNFGPSSEIYRPLLSRILALPYSHEVEIEIRYGSNRVATLNVQADAREVLSSTAGFMFTLILIGLLSLVLAAVLSARGLRWLLGPIENLSKLANDVRNSNNYSLRAPVHFPDEVGRLTEEFNGMLEKVEQRDLFLENEVAARTAELVHQATHDLLTGLPNRRGLQKFLLQLVSRNDETTSHALLILDLDQFKVVNDTCGHAAGDALLQKLSLELKKIMRGDDCVARLGGDEFAVLLRDVDEPEMARVAEQIRLMVQQLEFQWDAVVMRTGVSIGALLFESGNTDVQLLLKQADSACFVAKDSGRDRVCIFHDNDLNLTQRSSEMLMVRNIQSATENNRLLLFSQSLVPLNKIPEMEYSEVLIRMADEDKGCELILPDDFLPIAQRYGIATKIDKWVVNHVLEFLHAHPELHGRHGFWINLTSSSLFDADFIEFLERELRSANLSNGSLTFEITETVFIENLDLVAANMKRIKALGCRFALDDFGSGASSLQYLKDLPLDILKIDGGFVRNIVDDPADYLVTKSLIDIATTMGLETVAEQIEDSRTLSKVRDLGVDYGQGWFWGMPEPLETVASDIKKLPV